jgi:hypothetical protein
MSVIWTLEENTILIEKYPDAATVDLLVLLPGRTYSSITGHANVLGIHKSELFHASGLSGRICSSNDIGLKTRFAKNMAGWNKGKKQVDYMSAEKIEKTKATRFKKGQDPHNTVPIGHERISRDGYLEVKVKHKKGTGKNDNFVAKHRIIYEKRFGPIPKNCNVEFLDGDKLNFEESNFVLRTKKENLLMNTMRDQSIVKRFLGVREPELVEKIIAEMPEIIELKRNTIKLNQKINKQYAKSTE